MKIAFVNYNFTKRNRTNQLEKNKFKSRLKKQKKKHQQKNRKNIHQTRFQNRIQSQKSIKILF